jgi:N-acetylneuraminic acid mutarotase
MWKEIVPKGSFVPESRDEHSAVVHDDYMVVFGGFENGVRTNSMVRYNFESNTWSEFKAAGGPEPQPRAGHSALIYDDKMWIFGGKDDDNEKLNDFWSYSF